MTPSPEPLSFLIIVADQLPAHALGFAGDPIVRTPNLDALAARSMVFNRTHVANPICMPNRASMITGRYPSSHGTRVNGIPLDDRSDTFARVLRRAGYRTGAAGKLHLQPYGATPDLTSRLVGPASDAVSRPSSQSADDWATWERRSKHAEGFVPLPGDYYGFDEVDLVIGAADTAGGHYSHWLRENGIDPAAVQGRDNALARYDGWEQVYQTAVPPELYPTSYIAQSTCRFLESSAADDSPFLFWASFPDPHHPFTPPGHYYDMYEPDLVRTEKRLDDDLQSYPFESAPPHIKSMAARRGVQSRPFDCWAPTPGQLSASLAAAYGMITMVDDAVGEILNKLESTGLADQTVVVFTSDHGDMWGQHGLLLKHGVHYDSCTRVPLIIDVPGSPAGTTNALTSSLDIAATVIALAAQQPYRDIHGADLAPLLAGKSDGFSWRTSVVVEEDEVFGLDGLPGPFRMRTLITDDARLTLYADQPFGELYDLRSDPGELKNLFDNSSAVNKSSAALQAELTQKLLAFTMSTQDSGIAPRFSA